MALAALTEDYFFIAPLLQQRLVDCIPGVPVEVVERPEQVFQADKRAKVLKVMWAGDRFSAEGSARTTTLYQRWLVLLGIASAAPGTDARAAEAGPLLSKVHGAVVGWTPAGAVRSFTRANAPLAPNFTASNALFPLGFEISLSI